MDARCRRLPLRPGGAIRIRSKPAKKHCCNELDLTEPRDLESMLARIRRRKVSPGNALLSAHRGKNQAASISQSGLFLSERKAQFTCAPEARQPELQWP